MVDLNSISLLTDQETIKFLEDHLNEILEDPALDLLSKLKIRLLSLPLVLRDGFKNKLLEFLKNSNSSLTNQPITKNSGLKLPPTVSNWINDYSDFAGVQANQEEYFQKSPAYRGLNPEDRLSLKKLIELYDFLRKKESIEEEMVVRDRQGRMRILKKEGFVDLTKPEGVKTVPEVPKIESTKPEEKTKASFYFHPEDEDEFKQHQEKISQFELPKTQDVDQIIEEVITENNLKFEDPVLKTRFISVAKVRLKEIRGVIETKDLLTRSTKIGGLNYPEELADQILNSISQRIPKMQEIIDQEEEVKKEAAEQAPEIPGPAIPKPPTVPQRPYVPPSRIQPADFVRPLEGKPETPEFRPMPRIIPRMERPVTEPERPRVEDIKRPGRLTGPVEELKNMNLNDFRRLGTAYIGSIRKLYEKINLLSEESFQKRAEGIKAWRQSPVYKLYLEMGGESMNQGKTIHEVVISRQNQGFPYLSEQEFSGLADMNKRLRF